MLAWLGFAPGDGTQIVRWSCTVYGPGCVGTVPDLGTCDHVDHFCGESEPRGKHDSCAIHPIRSVRGGRFWYPGWNDPLRETDQVLPVADVSGVGQFSAHPPEARRCTGP